MPPSIQVLPETLANQIAAGEVVERPAAAVKELVENALDAGARRVEVDLVDGGCRLVRVRDDGSGMGREDALLSLQRHATSKLRSKDDLFAIATYGFRGEALPSIAAISRFTLLTCEAGAAAGTRIEVEGGRVASVEDAGAPPGTSVEARDLFWNVPARRKFLKRAATEQAHAIEAVLRLALPRPEVEFTVRENGRVLLRLPAGEAAAVQEERAEEALGREVRGRLLPVSAHVRGVRARGLAASPAIERSNAAAVWLFVNGRAVRDRQLTHAVLRSYGEVMPHGRYPAALVFIDVAPRDVDVNVHPAKAEVRLADARAAHEAIGAALRPALASGAWLPLDGTAGVAPARSYAIAPADDRTTRVAEALQRYGERAVYERPRWQGDARSGAGVRPMSEGAANVRAGGEGAGAARPAGVVAGAQAALIPPQPYFAGLRYLGQLHRTYLVCEGPRGLVLVDQHAAHERMNYQRLRRAADERRGHVQPLLMPILLRLAPAAAARIAEGATDLAAIGVEVEPFGGGSLAVKALPGPLASLKEPSLAALLTDLAEELSASGRGESLERRRDALLARAACHASVRAHDALGEAEARALLGALDATDYGARCAHGRPVVAEWTEAEIEKRFGRDYESHAHAAPPEAL
ncbi:MAG: DNA mismatch repair endonuclease MutL [Deltaproteobacteria bacterium]|nr:MAG: DNA mismatch repair endonuclease MutL [Deltaproteobacteria bacterium]